MKKEQKKETIEERVDRIKGLVRNMYKATADVVRELEAIEKENAWVEMKGFEDKTFYYFLEANFDFGFSTFNKMKSYLNDYGKMAFNELGYKILHKVSQTSDPKSALKEIKKAKKNNKIVSMKDYKNILEKYKKPSKINKKSPKKDVFDDPLIWLKNQINEWINTGIIVKSQGDLILEYYEGIRKKKRA
jgi:hypothetical protein